MNDRKTLMAFVPIALLLAACLRPDPLYCDEAVPCPVGRRCDLARRTCQQVEPGGEAHPDLSDMPTAPDFAGASPDLATAPPSDMTAPPPPDMTLPPPPDMASPPPPPDMASCPGDDCKPLALFGVVRGYGRLSTHPGQDVIPYLCPTGTVDNGPPFPDLRQEGAPPRCIDCACAPEARCRLDIRQYSALDCSGTPAVISSTVNDACGLSLQSSTRACAFGPAWSPCQPTGLAKVSPWWQRVGQLCVPSGLRRDCTTLRCIKEQVLGAGAYVAFDGAVACPAGTVAERWSNASRGHSYACDCACASPSTACSGSQGMTSDCASRPAAPLNACVARGASDRYLHWSFTPGSCGASGRVTGTSSATPMTLCRLP